MRRYLLFTLALTAVLGLCGPLLGQDANDPGFRNRDVAGRYAFTLDRPGTLGHFGAPFRAFGVIILHEDGRIEGRRTLFRYHHVTPTLDSVLEEEKIEQTFSGTYTMDTDGFGSGTITVQPRPPLYSRGPDIQRAFQPDPEESFRFVVSEAGCRLLLAFEGSGLVTSWAVLNPPPPYVMSFWMDGTAVRQDVICRAGPPNPQLLSSPLRRPPETLDGSGAAPVGRSR